MKKVFLFATTIMAASMLNAEVINIDLKTAQAVAADEGCSATFAVAEDVLTVNYKAGEWEWAGVEFPLDNLTKVPSINYNYKGDGAKEFGESGVVLFVYLRDSEGNRWIKSDYWPNLTNTEWQNEAIKPDKGLEWDDATYKLGEKPFTRLGFIANPGKETAGVFDLRNIKLTISDEGGEGGEGEGGESEGKRKPLTFNGEVLPAYSGFDRSMCGTVGKALNLDEVSGIACSRVTPGYIWMESDNFGDYIIATTEQGKDKAMKVNFPNLKALEIRYWDWEDLCGGVYNGRNYLFVGAFGDNNEEDDFYSIVYFEEPAITGGEVNVDPGQIQFVYPDGKSHNCESMMYDNVEQKLYIITKVYYDVCKVYSLPFRTDYGKTPQTLTYVCDLGLKSDIADNGKGVLCRGFHLATAADISPDGKYILIKNHNNIDGEAEYSWILYWERKDGESVADAVKRQPQVIDCYEYEWQGEAICWLDNSTFYTTSDSDGEPPIYKYVRAAAPEEAIETIQTDSNTKNSLIIKEGNMYIRTQDGLYTIDGKKYR